MSHSRWRGPALWAGLLLASTSMPAVSAGFVATTTNPNNSITAAAVPNATGLSAARPCSGGPSLKGIQSVDAGTASSVTVTTPSAAAGDVLIAFVVVSGGASTIAGPGGWSGLGGGASGGSYTGGWSLSLSGAPAASYGFSWTGGQHGAAVIMSYTGVDPWNPVAGIGQTSGTGTSATTSSTTASTPLRANGLVVFMLGTTGRPSPTNPGGTTRTATTGPTDATVSLFTWGAPNPATSSVSTYTPTWTGSQSWLSIAVFLQPPSPATVDPTVTLTWTPPANTWVTGYAVVRGGSNWTVSGRTTSTWSDTTTTAATAYTYTLRSTINSPSTWTSSGLSVNVAAC